MFTRVENRKRRNKCYLHRNSKQDAIRERHGQDLKSAFTMHFGKDGGYLIRADDKEARRQLNDEEKAKKQMVDSGTWRWH